MPKKTAAEKAALRASIAAAKPAFEAARRDSVEDTQRYAAEITMLQRRVLEEVAPVDLGHGDTLLIRTRISQAEGKVFQGLLKIWKQTEESGEFETVPDPVTKKMKKVPIRVPTQAAIRARCEILGLVTANPTLTAEWFEQNQDKFSALDTIPIILGFLDALNEPGRRVVRAATFRQNTAGTGTGGLLENSGGPGPA